ncbi:MAG: sorbosone dehydrogenase family protein [Abitibacteriaceae bacterium]|nr:sorbosone dehydrogenase family protein [Abditibacteriaceae bacterium]MBV9864501.1 sorbosone dehydrogenase family protein [Abditibacteriaceae bacterium]
MTTHRALLAALFSSGILMGCAQHQNLTTASSGTAIAQAKPVRSIRRPAKRRTHFLETGRTTTSTIFRSEGVPNGFTDASGLTVPRGFRVNLFAEGLTNPRRIYIAPGSTPQRYDVFVSESKANRIRVLREQNGDGHADAKFVFAQGLQEPYGIAFHPAGWLYVGNTSTIIRFPYRAGATSALGRPQLVSPLTKGGYNQHWTRNLLFSRDHSKLYVTVGSSCNTCEESDPQRAAISVMNPDGSGRRLFATGLRNPVGMAWRPDTNELWTVVNERDYLGNDVPPDYLTSVRDGAFYGWPYAYTDIAGRVNPDPDFGPDHQWQVQHTTAPTIPVQAHSAALGLAFYPNYTKNRLMRPPIRLFPDAYQGDAFLAYHGSWNRSKKTGYKIVRVHFQSGRPVSVTDFVTGFLERGRVWGRPVDVQIAPDGSLLFSDDDGGKIWRASYTG